MSNKQTAIPLSIGFSLSLASLFSLCSSLDKRDLLVKVPGHLVSSERLSEFVEGLQAGRREEPRKPFLWVDFSVGPLRKNPTNGTEGERETERRREREREIERKIERGFFGASQTLIDPTKREHCPLSVHFPLLNLLLFFTASCVHSNCVLFSFLFQTLQMHPLSKSTDCTKFENRTINNAETSNSRSMLWLDFFIP